MDNTNLDNYKEKLSKLSESERNLRNEYLKNIADGKVLGPKTGYSSVDKPWYNKYEISKINSDIPKETIYERLREKCIYDDLIAISYQGRDFTFKEMFEYIDNYAKGFYELGIRKNDVVSILITDMPEDIFFTYALNKIGAVTNIIDLRKESDKLIHAINDANSKMIIATDLFLKNIEAVKDKLCTDKIYVTSLTNFMPPLTKIACEEYVFKIKKKINYNAVKERAKKYPSTNEILEIGTKSNVDIKVERNDNDVVSYVYTSGTTGIAKAVPYTNYMYNAQVVNYENSVINAKPGEKMLMHLPPFLGFKEMLKNLALTLNVTLVLYPEYDPDNTAKIVFKDKINHVVGGPSDMFSFKNNKNLLFKDFSFIKTLAAGSDSLKQKDIDEINNKLAKHGATAKLIQGYGETETTTAATTNLPQYIVEDSVGIPLPKVNQMVIDDDGNELPYNEKGQICLSGDTIMNGYLNNQEETDKVIFKGVDGSTWIKTGDNGIIKPSGNLIYVDRLKRSLPLYTGIKAEPVDIENVLLTDPRVSECCVVGIPDARREGSYIPIANVVLDPRYTDNAENIIYELNQLCEEKLPPNYRPQRILMRDEIPLTPVKKVDFMKLAKICEEELSSYSKKR